MVGHEKQRSPARRVVLTLYSRVARQPLQRPRSACPEARLAYYPVVGQNLTRQTPRWYSRERLDYRAPMPYPTQAEGAEHVVDAYTCEMFEPILVPRRNDTYVIGAKLL